MIEMRWVTECSVEWCESISDYKQHYSEKKLQYRQLIGVEQYWSDWKDVQNVEIDI